LSIHERCIKISVLSLTIVINTGIKTEKTNK